MKQLMQDRKEHSREAFLFRGTEPLKITFTRCQFFPGLEVTDEGVGMVKTDVCRTAPEALVPDRILLTVLAFLFFSHDISVLFSFHRYFLSCAVKKTRRERVMDELLK
jgi:hypothetical protein